MTKFLPQALTDLADSALNRDTERLFAYHHATKHSYDSVRTSPHFLDWSNQPNPFRIYPGAPLIPLPRNPDFLDVSTFATMAALAGKRTGAREGKRGAAEALPEPQLNAAFLSRMLWHSMAISAWKQVPRTGVRYSLRVNPSSGNLHPTETHVALRGFAGIPDGLYHYRVDAHTLERRGRGDWISALRQLLKISRVADVPLIVALTSIFWREAWKYRDRAYRYCCLDLGHALMSLLLAARALGLRGEVVAQFHDLPVARALGLEHADEAPMLFLIFENSRGESRRETRAGEAAQLIPGTPNELSEEEVPPYLLLGMHRSTILAEDEPIPRSDACQADEPEEIPARRDAPLRAIARRRRSALDFNPQSPPIACRELEQLLDFATRGWPADWRGNLSDRVESLPLPGRDLVELYVYAHRIRGLDPGVYRFRPGERQLEQLHGGDVRRVAAYLSLEQPLAGHACFALSMIADLAAAAQRYGNRGYRYVHFEAGSIGQRLYLGAETLGWNATGIGAFYDDDVHRYLGFLEEGKSVHDSAQAAEEALVQLDVEASTPALSESREEQRAAAGHAAASKPRNTSGDGRHLRRQVIYHFAVGRAVTDPRLEAPEE